MASQQKFSVPHIALIKYDPIAAVAAELHPIRLSPDSLSRTVAAVLQSIRKGAASRQFGLAFAHDNRHIYITEEWSGAVATAEADKGAVGDLIRMLRTRGFLCQNENILAGVESQSRREEASLARAALRRMRKRKAVLREQEEYKGVQRRASRLRSVVDTGNSTIERSVRSSADCRDIAAGWPVKWYDVSGTHLCLPIPIPNGNESGALSGWAALEATGIYARAA